METISSLLHSEWAPYVAVAALTYGVVRAARAIARLARAEPVDPEGVARIPDDPSALPLFTGRYFRSERSGLWISHRAWIAPAPRAVLFVLHGLSEHSSRYEAFARQMVARGISVYALDHEGHGMSEGDRGYTPALERFVSDARQFIRGRLDGSIGSDGAIPERLPRFLMGHSMGGMLATLVADADPSLWRGLLLSGPALKADPSIATPTKVALVRLLSSVLPKLEVEKLPADRLCRTKVVVDQYRRDPLVHRRPMTLRMGDNLLRGMEQAMDAADRMRLPLLLFHGEHDRVVLIDGSREFFRRCPSSDKRFSPVESDFHETLNGPEGEGLTAEVGQWILERL